MAFVFLLHILSSLVGMEVQYHRENVILYSPMTEYPLLSPSLGVIWALMLAMKLLVLWTVVCPQLGFLQKQPHKTTQNLPQSSQVRKTNASVGRVLKSSGPKSEQGLLSWTVVGYYW